MASKVDEILTGISERNELPNDEKCLVIGGNGHFLHYCGVPERVLDNNPDIADEACLVISASSEEPLDGNDEELRGALKWKFGEEGSNPSDYVMFYQLPDNEETDVKEETKRAYDRVGESAALPGNLLKAAWIMYNMVS